jgi:hypothetical protein
MDNLMIRRRNLYGIFLRMIHHLPWMSRHRKRGDLPADLQRAVGGKDPNGVVEEIEVLTEVVAVWEELDVLWCFYICFFWFTSKSSLYFGVLNPGKHCLSFKWIENTLSDTGIPVQVHNRYGQLDDSEEESVWNLPPDDSPSAMDESPYISVFSIQVNIVWVSNELKTRLATLAYDFCVGESFVAETNLRASGYAIFFSDFIFYW